MTKQFMKASYYLLFFKLSSAIVKALYSKLTYEYHFICYIHINIHVKYYYIIFRYYRMHNS